MAKQRKILPARRNNAIDDTLLIRSAESLGRVIGSLQRQLDAARHLTARAVGVGSDGDAGVRSDVSLRKNGSQPSTKSSAKKTRSNADHKSKRAAKSTAAKKTTAASRSRSSSRPGKLRRA